MSGAAAGLAATHHLTDASEAVAHLSFLLLDGVQLIERTVKESLRQVACRPSRSRLLPRNLEVCHTQKSLVRGVTLSNRTPIEEALQKANAAKATGISLLENIACCIAASRAFREGESRASFRAATTRGIGWIAGKPAIVTLP